MKTPQHLSDHLPRQPGRLKKEGREKERRKKKKINTSHNSLEPFLSEKCRTQLADPSSAIQGAEQPKPTERKKKKLGWGGGGGGGGEEVSVMYMIDDHGNISPMP